MREARCALLSVAVCLFGAGFRSRKSDKCNRALHLPRSPTALISLWLRARSPEVRSETEACDTTRRFPRSRTTHRPGRRNVTRSAFDMVRHHVSRSSPLRTWVDRYTEQRYIYIYIRRSSPVSRVPSSGRRTKQGSTWATKFFLLRFLLPPQSSSSRDPTTLPEPKIRWSQRLFRCC